MTPPSFLIGGLAHIVYEQRALLAVFMTTELFYTAQDTRVITIRVLVRGILL